MWKIDAFMENGNKAPQETNSMFGYVLRCEGFEDKISFDLPTDQKWTGSGHAAGDFKTL